MTIKIQTKSEEINTTELCIVVGAKLKKRIRSSYFEDAARQMGKVKQIRRDTQNKPCYYWTEKEVEQLLQLI